MLSGEVYALKKAHEKAHTEACRLDKVLSGFDPTRRYEVFNEPMHAETLKRNEELAKEALPVADEQQESEWVRIATAEACRQVGRE